MLLQSPFVTRVNVLGPVSKYKEQLQITAGAATSSITSSKYTYADGEFISTNLGTASEIVYSPSTGLHDLNSSSSGHHHRQHSRVAEQHCY